MPLETARLHPRDATLGRSVRLLRLMLATALVFSAAFVATTTSASAQTGTGSLRVVHGLRGIVADVYLDDSLVLQTFEPERSTDLLPLATGDHRLDVRLSGSPATAAPMVSTNFVTADSEVLSVVLHLSASSQPALSGFVEDETPVAAGQTRVVVRHTAAAPSIDARLDDAPVVTNLANPGQGVSQVAAGTYQLSVTQAGGNEVLAPAQTVPLAEGTANDMYFIGDESAGTLSWIAVQTGGLATPPARVATGDSGLVAPHGGPSLLWPMALATGLVLLMGTAAVGRRIAVVRARP